MQNKTDRPHRLRDVASIRELENRYMQVIAASLPSILVGHGQIPCRSEIHVIDTLERDQRLLRAIPIYSRNDQHQGSFRASIQEDIDGELISHEIRSVDVDSIHRIVSGIRERDTQRGITDAWQRGQRYQSLLVERSLPLQGSVLWRSARHIARHIGKEDPCYVLENYLTKTSFQDAKGALRNLLPEILANLSHVDDEMITPDLLASMSAVLLPFSALGVFKGVVAWWATSAAEVEEIKREVTRCCREHGLVAQIGTAYSSALIDVFTSFLIHRMGAGDSSGATMKTMDSVRQGLRVLFPSENVDFLSSGPFWGRHSVDFHIQNDRVRDLLGTDFVRWHVYPALYLEDGASALKRNAYLELIETKLETIAARVAETIEATHQKEFANAAHVFNHELKNRLHDLGHDDVLKRIQQGDSEALSHAELVLTRVGHLYAVADIFRAIGKLNTGLLPPEWADPEYLKTWPTSFSSSHTKWMARFCDYVIRATAASYIRQGNKRVSLYKLSSDGSEPKAIDWPSVDLANPPTAGPPFIRRPFEPGPVALLAGLTELVRNAVRYVNDPTRTELLARRHGEAWIRYSVVAEGSTIRCEISNPLEFEEPVHSTSIDKLNLLYRKIAGVEMGPPRVRRIDGDGLYRVDSSFSIDLRFLRFEGAQDGRQKSSIASY